MTFPRTLVLVNLTTTAFSAGALWALALTSPHVGPFPALALTASLGFAFANARRHA